MKTLAKKAALLLLSSTVACFALIGNAVAEKREQTFVKTESKTISKSVFTLDADLKHEITQLVNLGHPKFSSPDFKVKEEWTFYQSDTINGTGTFRGYFLEIHEDGSQTYGTYQGTETMSSKPDGSWESGWEGSYQYSGGTGKYKNVKGGGRFNGRSSSKEPGIREEGRETIEY